MRVVNVHDRVLAVPVEKVGNLLDTLATRDDRLWPHETWPAMRFDRPHLEVGAVGGHGPVRYLVEAYEPGRWVRFRFTGPKGFDGFHQYDVSPAPAPVDDGAATCLRHTLEMTVHGPARVTWPLFFRPLHDALIEDSLDKAAHELGLSPKRPRRWSRRVRLLRDVGRGFARPPR